MDASRLIDVASGWIDQGGGDISSIHNYFLPLKVIPQAGQMCCPVRIWGLFLAYTGSQLDDLVNSVTGSIIARRN